MKTRHYYCRLHRLEQQSAAIENGLIWEQFTTMREMIENYNQKIALHDQLTSLEEELHRTTGELYDDCI